MADLQAATADLSALEAKLGWHFHERALLQAALTHSSYVNEHPEAAPHNERLEFLGDAVLNLVAARLLFERDPAASEGTLSRTRARVVCTEGLAAQAAELELDRYLRLGAGQQRASTAVPARLLENAYEALAGAVLLDGGYDAVVQCFSSRLGAAIETATQNLDWKTELQELCHVRGLMRPAYAVLAITGPDHARIYRCEVRVGGAVMGIGEGSSKKTAEQTCARVALADLGAGKRERPSGEGVSTGATSPEPGSLEGAPESTPEAPMRSEAETAAVRTTKTERETETP